MNEANTDYDNYAKAVRHQFIVWKAQVRFLARPTLRVLKKT